MLGRHKKKHIIKHEDGEVSPVLYRPFNAINIYLNYDLVDIRYQMHKLFPTPAHSAGGNGSTLHELSQPNDNDRCVV